MEPNEIMRSIHDRMCAILHPMYSVGGMDALCRTDITSVDSDLVQATSERPLNYSFGD